MKPTETSAKGHTPGPWVVCEHRDGFDIRPALGSPADSARIRPCMAYVPKVRFDGAAADCGQTVEEQAANARLIAASPAMLELLTDVGQWLEIGLSRGEINRGTANRNGDLVTQIRSLLTQAQGTK